MRTQTLIITLCVTLLGVASPSIAQQGVQPGTQQQAAERAAEEAARRAEQAKRNLEAAERQAEQQGNRRDLEDQLKEARREMEEAAREVAQLSQQLSGQYFRGWSGGLRNIGRRSMLGINIEDTEQGVRVAGVSPNGPAADAGIKIGDTITAINGADLTDRRETSGNRAQSPSALLIGQLVNVDPGQEVTLRVLHDGGVQADVKVEARDMGPSVFVNALPFPPAVPAPPGAPWFWRADPWADMQLVALTPELGKYFGADKGLLVVRAPGNDQLRLRDGDVILDIGGRAPTSPEHALRILASFQEGETLRMTIMRNQRRESLEFKVPEPSQHE